MFTAVWRYKKLHAARWYFVCMEGRQALHKGQNCPEYFNLHLLLRDYCY